MKKQQLPTKIKQICDQASDKKRQQKALTAFINSREFTKAVLHHKQGFPETSTEEYSIILESFLLQYNAGVNVKVNALLDTISAQLDKSLLDIKIERTISRSNLRDSFLPFFKLVGLIVGEKPVTWVKLDIRNFQQKFIDQVQYYYELSKKELQKSEAQILLENTLRDQAVLKRNTLIATQNQALADNLKTKLEHLKRVDAKCTKLAQELNIPYKKAHKLLRNKGEKPTLSTERIKQIGFLLIISTIVALGIFGNSTPSTSISNRDELLMAKHALTKEQVEFRQLYIKLYLKDNGLSKESQKILKKLAGSQMMPDIIITKILKTIDRKEVGLPKLKIKKQEVNDK